MGPMAFVPGLGLGGPGPAALGPGPGPGPAQMPWAPWIFQQKVPEQIPFRAALASSGRREMPWVLQGR